MERLNPLVHQYISATPPVNLIPGWIINETITHLVDPNWYSEAPERKLVCSDFDPYCFAPFIDGYHGHLAFGRLGLPMLKRILTRSQDEKVISTSLNTLCDLLHDPEKAAEAMRLNIIFQLRRLLDHDSWYVRQRVASVLKILVTQQTARLRLVNDDRLMAAITDRMKDREASVRRTIYDLIHRLSTYYFAVPKLLEKGFIKLIMGVLKENFLDKPSSEEEVVLEPGDPIMSNQDDYEDEVEPEDTTTDEVDMKSNENVEEYCVDDKNVCALATLMDALVNLMSFSRDATLEAICYDVLKLKLFFAHEEQTVRILTWNIFKQIFTTDVGQLSMVPHNVLEDMMNAFNNDLSPEELEEVTGTLMLALIKVENRIAALEWGVLDRVLALAKEPNLSPGKRLAALNVLSHLAELPDVRKVLKGQLVDTAIKIRMDDPNLEHHVDTHIERVLWEP